MTDSTQDNPSTETNLPIWPEYDKQTWSIIDSYFKDTRYFVTKHHIDSYNIFIKDRLPKTLRQNNPIHSKKFRLDRDGRGVSDNDDNYEMEVQVKVWLGCQYQSPSAQHPQGQLLNNGKNIFLTKPTIYETKIIVKKDEEGNERLISEQTHKQLFPNEARLKNISYNLLIEASIHLEYIYFNRQGVEIESKRQIIHKIDGAKRERVGKEQEILSIVNLAKIPLMLHSSPCILHNTPKNLLYSMGECPYDQGGYFIIDGKEKVMVAQEWTAPNKIITVKHKWSDGDPLDHSAMIRSEDLDKFEPAKTCRIFLRKTVTKNKQLTDQFPLPHMDKITTEQYSLDVIFPGIDREKCGKRCGIPIYLLFKALGIESEKKMLELILHDIDNETSRYLYEEILQSVFYYSRIQLSNLLSSLSPPIDEKDSDDGGDDDEKLQSNNNLLECSQLDAMKLLLRRYIDIKELQIYTDNTIYTKTRKQFSLHSLTEETQQASLLSRLNMGFIQNVLQHKLLPHVGTNFYDKSVFLGYMAQQVLYTKIGVLKPTNRDSYMNKRVYISGILFSSMFRDLYFRYKNHLIHSLNVTINLNQYDGMIEKKLISAGNFVKIFQPPLITDGFRRAFKIHWCLQDVEVQDWQKGVVQDLNRLSYIGSLSHLRQTHTPLSAGSKLREPRELHLTTWGYLCPCETPSGGAKCGVIKSFSVLCQISFGCDTRLIHRYLLRNLGMKSLHNISLSTMYYMTKVLINGAIKGVHNNGYYLYQYLLALRRNAYINIYTSIVYNPAEKTISIVTDSGRCLRPLYILQEHNSTRQFIITPEDITQIQQGNISWNQLLYGSNKSPNLDVYQCHLPEVVGKDFPSYSQLLLQGGCIEYIDTEESDASLFATTNKDIRFNPNAQYTHCEIHPSLVLGCQASTIPFPERNPGARNTYSGAQGKQAIGVYSTNFLNRYDNESRNILYYPQRPIVSTRISKFLNIDKLSYGENAIVAIACYSGYNQEDSILINKSSLERGMFRTLSYRTYSSNKEEVNEYSDIEEIFRKPNVEDTLGLYKHSVMFNNLDDRGIIKRSHKDGSSIHVTSGDILIGKAVVLPKKSQETQLYKNSSVYVRREESGYVDSIFESKNENEHFFKVRLRKIKIPRLGDKFASRAAQKGTIGLILPAEDMPMTKEGIVPDIIVNPHAIPSRMTLGHLLEGLLGKTCCITGNLGDATAFTNIQPTPIEDVLELNGYERYGNEVMYNGRTGEQLTCNIFIGPTYYQRLKHIVYDKINFRATGPRTMVTKQPAAGRARNGGLRVGEMERDALLAHGLSYFLKESMVERSDGPSIKNQISNYYICMSCGLMGIVNPSKNIYKCNNCNKQNTFREVRSPHCFKLLLQELEAMGISMKLITETNISDWNHSALYKAKQDIVSEAITCNHLIHDKGVIRHIRKHNSMIRKLLAITSSDQEPLEYFRAPDFETSQQITIKVTGSIEKVHQATLYLQSVIQQLRLKMYPIEKIVFISQNLYDKLSANKKQLLLELTKTYELTHIPVFYLTKNDYSVYYANLIGLRKYVDNCIDSLIYQDPRNISQTEYNVQPKGDERDVEIVDRMLQLSKTLETNEEHYVIIQKIESSLFEFKEKLLSIEAQKNKIEEDIQFYQEQLRKININTQRVQYEKIKRKLTQIKESLTAIKKKKENIQLNITKLQQRRKQLNDELKERPGKKLETDIEQLEDTVQDILTQQKSSEKEQTIIDDDISPPIDITSATSQNGGKNTISLSQNKFMEEAIANKQELNQNQYQQIGGNSSFHSLFSKKQNPSSINNSQQSSLQLPEFT